MGNPYKSPESEFNSGQSASSAMFVVPFDWIVASIVLGVAITAGVFGFSSGVGELPWQQSPANTWQSMIWGMLVGVPSALTCFALARMVSPKRPMLYVTWSIAAPIFPFVFSWLVIGALAGC